jgi:hypothetical protein
LHARATEKADAKIPSKRPSHELPGSFPAGLKRPDLTATVDGKTIASEFQRQLFDDIKHGNCVRCHAKDHARSTCKEPAGRWETKFDENKDKYWLGTLKWQQKSQEEKAGSAPKTPPTLIQKKKESRRQHLPPPLPDDDSDFSPLQCRKQLIATDDPEDEEPPPLTTSDAAAHYHALQILHPLDSDDSEDSELTPEELVEAIIESTCINTLDSWGAEAINRMTNNPIFTILHTGNGNALVMFSDGTHGVFLRSDVDAAYRWIGSTRPNSQALPTRATKPRGLISDPDSDGLTLISDPDSDGDLPPAIPSDEFSSSAAAPPRRPPLPRSYIEFQRDTVRDATRYLHYDVWDLLAPVEFYNAVKDWEWNPETGHIPPTLSPSEFATAVRDCTNATQSPPAPGARPLPITSVHPDASSSSSVPKHYPLVPRAPWMLEGDAWTDDEVDADWRTAMEVLFPPTIAPTPPLPAWRQAQMADLNRPPPPPSPWPPPPWGTILLANPPMNRTPISHTATVAAPQ